MPNEKIVSTFINNGPDDSYTNTLRVMWKPKDEKWIAPAGWVTEGYAHILIAKETENEGESHYVELDGASMDHLIRVLKRIRRRTFEAEK